MYTYVHLKFFHSLWTSHTVQNLALYDNISKCTYVILTYNEPKTNLEKNNQYPKY